jgi:very-short-patch-repair endonuclease
VLNNSRNRSDEAKGRARELRGNMSVSEKVLWGYLRGDKLGATFRRQVAVLGYILDFYCPAAWLCVEVDGEQHEAAKSYDAQRDCDLEAIGITTIRIPSFDIFHNDKAQLERWLKLIEITIQARRNQDPRCLPTLHPQPPPPPGREEGTASRHGGGKP